MIAWLGLGFAGCSGEEVGAPDQVDAGGKAPSEELPVPEAVAETREQFVGPVMGRNIFDAAAIPGSEDNAKLRLSALELNLTLVAQPDTKSSALIRVDGNAAGYGIGDEVHGFLVQGISAGAVVLFDVSGGKTYSLALHEGVGDVLPEGATLAGTLADLGWSYSPGSGQWDELDAFDLATLTLKEREMYESQKKQFLQDFDDRKEISRLKVHYRADQAALGNHLHTEADAGAGPAYEMAEQEWCASNPEVCQALGFGP